MSLCFLAFGQRHHAPQQKHDLTALS